MGNCAGSQYLDKPSADGGDEYGGWRDGRRPCRRRCRAAEEDAETGVGARGSPKRSAFGSPGRVRIRVGKRRLAELLRGADERRLPLRLDLELAALVLGAAQGGGFPENGRHWRPALRSIAEVPAAE